MVLCPIKLFRLYGLRLNLSIANIYIYQRPKAEGFSKNRVAKKFGYRVEVCLFRRRRRTCLSRYARIKKKVDSHHKYL